MLVILYPGGVLCHLGIRVPVLKFSGNGVFAFLICGDRLAGRLVWHSFQTFISVYSSSVCCLRLYLIGFCVDFSMGDLISPLVY